MSSAPKVFISHSSAEQDRAVAKNLCVALKDQGLQVLVDFDFEPGSDWSSRIDHCLHACHAAVVLLSETAVKSTWVHKEVVVITSRKHVEAKFALIVVPLGNVNPELIRAHSYLGDIARLQDWQWLKVGADNNIIDAVKESLQGLVPTETPFDGLVLCLEGLFGTDSLQTLLQKAVRALEIDPAIEGPAHGAADALIRALLCNPGGALKLVGDLVQSLRRKITPTLGQHLMELLKGMWVQAEAAAHLIELSERKVPAGINCSNSKFTAQSYAQRAWPHPHLIKIAEAGPARTLQEIEQALFKAALRKDSPESAKAYLAQPGNKQHVLLVFPAPDATEEVPSELLPDKLLLDELRDKYPAVTIVVATGNVDPQGFPHFTLVHPPLGAEDELKQYRAYEIIEDLVANLEPWS